MPDLFLTVILFIGSALAFVVIGGVLWFLARKSNSTGTFNGFGTKLYGNKRTPGGRIATKWVVFFFMPIVPVKSYKVISQQKTRVSTVEYRTDYALTELPGLYWPQAGLIGIIAALFWVLVLFSLSASLVEAQRARNAAKPLSGAAPDFTLTVYPGYDGGLGKPQIKLSDLSGQVVLISFCASWSPPCHDELSILEKAWRQYRDKGAVVLGISYMDTEAAALEYLKQVDVTYPNGPDVDTKIAPIYHVRGAPEFLLVDRQGQVIWTKQAPVTEAELTAQLDQALAK
jgi:peroxiredoxin